MYKNLYVSADSNVKKMNFDLRNKVSQRITRNSSDVHIDYWRTAVGQKAVSVSGAKLWNSIHMNIRNSNTIVMFKSHRYQHFLPLCRFGKSIHISMISNSVTHLRSYTNSAIADIAENSAPISPVTPHDRRRLLIERRHRRIEWPPRDCRAKCRRLRITAASADIVASNDECFMMFHNVLRVSWMF